MRPARHTATLLLTAIVSGCGTVVSETFGPVGDEVEPTESASAAASPDASAGTFRIVNMGAVDGPGRDLVDAIAADTGEWDLVNGAVLMDLDGTIWFCERVMVEVSPPACSEPRLRVVDWPQGTADWDLGQAGVTNLQEAEGVLWHEDYQLVGIVEP